MQFAENYADKISAAVDAYLAGGHPNAIAKQYHVFKGHLYMELKARGIAYDQKNLCAKKETQHEMLMRFKYEAARDLLRDLISGKGKIKLAR